MPSQPLIVRLSRPGRPGGVKWDLAVVWVCFPLMTNGAAYPSMCLLATCVSLQKCLFQSFANFLIGLFIFFIIELYEFLV